MVIVYGVFALLSAVVGIALVYPFWGGVALLVAPFISSAVVLLIAVAVTVLPLVRRRSEREGHPRWDETPAE